MKKHIITLLLMITGVLAAQAGVTTYTFTSKAWASRVDATVCDGVTDGWVSDKDAYAYYAGNTYADGSLNNRGVSVKTSTDGAGATSVVTFTNVRRLTFNLCQNSSKGRGVIYVQIGNGAVDSLVINRPATSGAGTLNRDSVISISPAQSGQIRFWVHCTENAININTLTIHSAEGGASPFTADTYQLVTDAAQLQDSDQIIIGVASPGVNYVMGYFDETVSQNNIHAISARYSADRISVSPDDRAIYTLRRHINGDDTVYTIVDNIRYEEAYLVASGGQTKNRLALWDSPTSPSYGEYGRWTIRVGEDGQATIMSRGTSLGKYLQYNAQNTPTLFGCYAQPGMQTPVCIYRRVAALGDTTAIVAPLVNFGTTLDTQGSRTIQINAHGLSGDITASLCEGTVFSLSASTLDQEGDALTIHFRAPAPGRYSDTIVLQSGTIETRAIVLLHVVEAMTIAEAKMQPDYSITHLGDVVVTKKFDTQIYIRDETGSMVLFDTGNGETGKRYGAGLKNGDVLHGVVGRSLNYYGVPEMSPIAAFTTLPAVECLPEEAGNVIDSADVCRYLRLDSVVVDTDNKGLVYRGRHYSLTDKFNIGSLTALRPTTLTCIVSWDWNTLQLYPIRQELPTGVESQKSKVESRKQMIEGVLYIHTAGGTYGVNGQGF